MIIFDIFCILFTIGFVLYLGKLQKKIFETSDNERIEIEKIEKKKKERERNKKKKLNKFRKIYKYV